MPLTPDEIRNMEVKPEMIEEMRAKYPGYDDDFNRFAEGVEGITEALAGIAGKTECEMIHTALAAINAHEAVTCLPEPLQGNAIIIDIQTWSELRLGCDSYWAKALYTIAMGIMDATLLTAISKMDPDMPEGVPINLADTEHSVRYMPDDKQLSYGNPFRARPHELLVRFDHSPDSHGILLVSSSKAGIEQLRLRFTDAGEGTAH